MSRRDPTSRLLEKARRGDAQALAELVAATQVEVWRLCAHLVDRQSADDLTQETYLRAVRALDSFRADAPFRSWLLTIARRTCAAEIDARQQRRRLLKALPRPGAVPDHARRVGLELLLEALNPEQRAAFVLTQLLGCSYLEAAAVCECPVGTVRSRVARAREALVLAAGGERLEASGPA
ncbi:MAG TPA: sigma-70 family RNA polymerase sigma factor [Frankiaceae bacterium]|nr:sigma-70 family RNA polymerase sigma factor [Frankiaceae bacterium]